MKKKVLKNVIISFAIAFLALNIFWLLYINATFQKYANITTDERFPGISISSKNGWTYSVSDIHYLKFHGNLAIENNNGNFLIIWLHLFSDNKYGFTLNFDNISYQFTINDKCELVSSELYSDDEIALFNEHTNEVQTMIKAFEEWKTAADDRNEAYFDNYKEY